MGKMVPKGDASNVRSIKSAGHAGGRRTSRTYNPATGEDAASRGSLAEYNAFTVETSGYREDRFYTRSVDADGHGQKLNLRVPQGIDSQMYAAVAEIPEYRTIHDLIRDAVLHRLEYLQKRYSLSHKAQIMLSRERAKADRHERVQDSDEQEAMVKEMDDTLGMLHQRGDWSLLAEELEADSETAEFSMRGEYQRQAQMVIRKWKEKSKEQIAKHREMLDE